jgi:hypothetical protein
MILFKSNSQLIISSDKENDLYDAKDGKRWYDHDDKVKYKNVAKMYKHQWAYVCKVMNYKPFEWFDGAFGSGILCVRRAKMLRKKGKEGPRDESKDKGKEGLRDE